MLGVSCVTHSSHLDAEFDTVHTYRYQAVTVKPDVYVQHMRIKHISISIKDGSAVSLSAFCQACSLFVVVDHSLWAIVLCVPRIATLKTNYSLVVLLAPMRCKKTVWTSADYVRHVYIFVCSWKGDETWGFNTSVGLLWILHQASERCSCYLRET